MLSMNDSQQFIFNDLHSKGITKNAIRFFLELIEHFSLNMNEVKSTSKRLAVKYGFSERSIQRYVKALEDNHYINKQPVYNYKNPEHSFIEYNIYTPTFKTEELLEKAINYSKRHRTVFFQ